MAPEEKKDYDKIFDSLDPENGLLSEEKVRFVLMGLKIEVSMLDKIWSLSDQDGDGCLDRYEWTVAVHLTLGALEGDKVINHQYPHLIIIPNTLQLPAQLYREEIEEPKTELEEEEQLEEAIKLSFEAGKIVTIFSFL